MDPIIKKEDLDKHLAQNIITSVKIVDIKIPFMSLVWLLVEIAVAAVPAMVMIYMVYYAIWQIFLSFSV